MKNWVYHDIGVEGQTKLIKEIDIWLFDWGVMEERSLKIPHPQHPNQNHYLTCYCIKVDGKIIEFAAAEVSNMVWCIYVAEE